MNIISLLASPRGAKGNTAALLELVMEGARNEGAKAETIILPGSTVQPCKACDVCHKVGTCAQKDEFKSIKEKIDEADGLVLASPNYIWSVSAQMKAFMDRCCGVIHCMSFEGKYGASVVTSGGGGEEPIVQYMNEFLVTTGITPVGSVWATMGAVSVPTFSKETRNEAVQLGRKLVRSWKDKVTIPIVEESKNHYKERFRFLVEYRKEDWPYEWEYWQKRK